MSKNLSWLILLITAFTQIAYSKMTSFLRLTNLEDRFENVAGPIGGISRLYWHGIPFPQPVRRCFIHRRERGERRAKKIFYCANSASAANRNIYR
jgi:hypothetical protein